MGYIIIKRNIHVNLLCNMNVTEITGSKIYLNKGKTLENSVETSVCPRTSKKITSLGLIININNKNIIQIK
jgi:hypothetical protein